MKYKKSSLLLLELLLLASCGSQKTLTMKKNASPAEQLFRKGEFTRLTSLRDSLKTVQGVPEVLVRQADSLNEIASRIRLDFNLLEPDADKQISSTIGPFSLADKKKWEDNDWLEYKMIDGRKYYFYRAVSNMKLRMNQYNDSVSKIPSPLSPLSTFCLKHTAEVISQTTKPGDICSPVNYTITYKITVKPDVVPAGETICCWLPYPKENRARQSQVKLLETSQSAYTLAPDTVEQRSLYMEKKAEAGQPTLFQIKYSFRGAAQYFDLNHANILPYDKKSAIYKEYTAQKGQHVVFTPEIKKLADQIVGQEKDPVQVVRKLYYWIDQHILWSGSLEYSTMENIPQYVLDHRRGDCGMQTLLFMTMARYKGIPVRWQSGWMLHPVNLSLHDWSEVYYEGLGWVPLDMSFGLQKSKTPSIHDFYISGIDAYRLIVNEEFSAPFVPKKKFVRSETIDFQRGEVEWRGGNLFFDKWDYSLHCDIAN